MGMATTAAGYVQYSALGPQQMNPALHPVGRWRRCMH